MEGRKRRTCARGSKHVTRNQKGRQMLNIISQNQTFIFLSPFKTIVIMASWSFFPHMNFKELRVKIHLNLKFWF
jgi:hypothetical protein